ncbi:hypothetical protein MMC21_002706 [Puttea exsequens]|nr:hypothetical protein [Puttea exsequens]
MHLTNTLSTLLFLFLSTLPEPSLSLGKVRGINCNSANPGFCIPTSFFAQGKIFDAARDVNTGTCLHWDYSYNGTFQIACYTFGGGETGFCLSTKHVAPNQTVTGQQIFDAMDRLQGHSSGWTMRPIRVVRSRELENVV